MLSVPGNLVLIARLILYVNCSACNFHEAVRDDLHDLRTPERRSRYVPRFPATGGKWESSSFQRLPYTAMKRRVFWLIDLVGGVKIFR
jgi:hypothetical protein